MNTTPAPVPVAAQCLALLPEPCVLVEACGRVRAANPAWTRVLGRAAPTPGQALCTLVHADDRDALRAALAALARGAEIGRLVARCQDGSGAWRAMAWTGHGDAVEAMVCLTLRPLPEGADMRDQDHARLRSLFEVSPIAITLSDLDTGRFLDVNPAYTALTGLTLSEMRQTDVHSLATEGGWRDALEDRRHALRTRGRYGPATMPGRRKDGSLYRARVHATVMRDPEGRALVWSFIDDVSADHARQAEGELLGHVLRSTAALVTLADPEGRITWINDAFERETGWSLAEAQGRTPGSLLQIPRTDPRTVERLRAALRARVPVRAEILNARRDGREIWLDLAIQPRLGPDGALLGFMAIQIDVTARKRLEDALRAERNRLRATLQALPDMLIELDADGRYERILCRDPGMLPHPPEAYVGRTLEEILPADIAAQTRQSLARVDAGDDVREVRHKRTLRGRQVLFESSVTRRAPTTEGARAGYLILTRDVTERARVEEEHAKLGEVVALTTNLVVMLDAACRVEWANPAFEAQTGWPLDEIRGRQLAPLVRHPDSDPATIARLEGALREGVPFRGEILNRTRDGRPYWVDFDVHPRRDRAGSLIGHVSVETVISARKALEAELASERDYLTGVMETLICGIVALDARGRIVFANDEAVAILGLARAGAAEGQHGPEWRIGVGPGAPQALAMLPFARVMATGRSVRDIHLELSLPDGTRRVLSVNAAPVRKPGLGARVVCALTDITARRRAEEALREAAEAAEAANCAKSRFLANMSHEIRTPLNGILGMAELMAERPCDDEDRAMLRTIRESGETLLTVLNDILDMSRIEAGKLTLEAEPLHPEDLVERIDRMYGPLARGRGLGWRVAVAPAARRPVLGDAHRLLQMLHNLVGNALKFTEQGEIGLGLDCSADGALVVTLRDTGIGMDAAALARVRSEFEQADGSVTRRYGGTGLGLAIVSRLVDMMGGTLTLDSAPGRGTEVRLRLPLPPARERVAATDGHEAEAGIRPLVGLSLLLADDNATNRRILQSFLERDGAEVTAVGDGRAALEAWRRLRFDAILLDISMPLMDGETALATMQAEAQARPRALPPVLAVTAHAMAEEAARYRAAGFAAHLTKPLRRSVLRDELLAVLARASPGALPLGSVPAASSPS